MTQLGHFAYFGKKVFPYQEEVIVFTKKLLRVQIGCWGLFYLFLMLYTLNKWEKPVYGFWVANIYVITYALAVYVNAGWLIPKFYQANKKSRYYFYSVIFLALLMITRMEVEHLLLLPLHLQFYNWSLAHFTFVLITNVLAFLFGALLKVAIDHIMLLRKQEEMRHQQLTAELNLLKAQVQPHFLFNTLNNIYYLAYTKNERTPEVVARLSDIMRYFVDEAPKDRVPLSAEISFLKNYIELEQIRMLHQASVRFDQNGVDGMLMIPPMLLIPLVENIFKHGIDKVMTENLVTISLHRENGYLVFQACNTVHSAIQTVKSGVGLTNLRKRLALLFGNDFTLETKNGSDHFTALLKFPVA